MLGLYCLGFVLVQVVRILSNGSTAQKKFVNILLLSPVFAYIMITMKLVTPTIAFLERNLQSLIGG